MRQKLTEGFLKGDRLLQTPQCVIMVGFPRTGKSTFVNQFVWDASTQLRKSFTIISGDDVRRALGVRYEPDLEAQVKATTVLIAESLMQRRQHVIIDDTNLTEKSRQLWIDIATANGYHWTIAEVACLPVAIHQRECEKHQFPWNTIERMRKEYQPVTGEQATRYTLVTREDQ